MVFSVHKFLKKLFKKASGQTLILMSLYLTFQSPAAEPDVPDDPVCGLGSTGPAPTSLTSPPHVHQACTGTPPDQPSGM